jgi:light-regulated signal transduction histidine kinase (bacteriophytochrome)
MKDSKQDADSTADPSSREVVGAALILGGLALGVVFFVVNHEFAFTLRGLWALAAVALLAGGGVLLLAAARRARRRAAELGDARAALHAKTDELARVTADFDQFAYVASHDLQEPLRAIASFTSLLSRRYRGKLDEQADEFIGHIEAGARRMSELLRDLLEFSRAGRSREAPGPVPAGRSLDAALEHLAPEIAAAKAEIVRSELPEVVADEAQLAQVFEHLVGNAIKFRGSAPLRVSIDAERKDGGWQFHVRDNGIGIDPKFAERIFVIFQRLHARDRYPGNGVGLAICKRIVERHGGRIAVDSRPDEGADFRFTLPGAGA